MLAGRVGKMIITLHHLASFDNTVIDLIQNLAIVLRRQKQYACVIVFGSLPKSIKLLYKFNQMWEPKSKKYYIL